MDFRIASSSMEKAAAMRRAAAAATILSFICFSLFSQVVISVVPASELHALLELKARIANSATSMELLRAWNESNSHNICTSWSGVTCTTSTDSTGLLHISGINLAGAGLVGSLPPQIGNLTFISTLNLSSNHLRGGIPAELSGCSSLQVLDLNQNNLTGPIPPSLSSLSTLQVLQLCNNSLSGPIPPPLFTNCTSLLRLYLCENALIGSIPASTSWQLPRLQRLSLWENNLTGIIPPSLGNCSSLVILQLNNNHLSGPIPSELGFLVQLTHLALDVNRLSGAIPPSLGKCKKLLQLGLNSNQLIGGVPEELGTLPNLTGLWLNQNSLTGSIPPGLANCSNLVTLQLISNQLSGPIPSELGYLAHLESLLLFNNTLIGSIPSTLGNCTQLVYLELSKNRVSGPIPTGIMNLEHLQRLSLSDNFISGNLKAPLNFSNTTSLFELAIDFNRIGGFIPTELAQLQGLQKLALGSNQFSGDIPWNSLSNCSHLFQLDMSHNHLAGGLAISSLGMLLNLKILMLQGNLLQGIVPDMRGRLSLDEIDLSSNKLNGTLPDGLANVLKEGKHLNFSHNDLSGNLPIWLGQLVMVQDIDLSYNHFMGTIPESLVESMSLASLNLSNNNLVGEFPPLSGNSSVLSSLDLSNNQLTGVLPSTLEYLQNLSFLNVSFNNFEGPIPLLGVFNHLDASSFQGNPGLCGQVIQKPCMPPHHAHSGWKASTLAALIASSIVLVATLVAICFFRYNRQSKSSQLGMVDQELRSFVETRHFSAQELWESTQGYSEENLVGEGAIGLVYRGVLPNGDVIAVKKFRVDANTCSREALLHEVHILSKLRHRNLVKVLGCVLNLELHALVLQFMPNGSLEQYLSQVASEEEHTERLSWTMVLKVAKGVANALAYLHHEYETLPIIHGDIKPSNILLDSELEAHLADFGLAKLAKSSMGAVSLTSNFKGSIGYMAPEFAYAAKTTTKVDIFSFGVVILEMLTGRGPTHELLQGVSLHDWVKHKLLLHDGVNLQEIVHVSLLQSFSSQTEIDETPIYLLLQMAVACTEEMPSKRPTMQQIKAFLELQHLLVEL